MDSLLRHRGGNIALYNLHVHGVIKKSNIEIYSAGVATVSSSNDPSFDQVKLSWLTGTGGSDQVNINLALLSNIWLAWGFLVNFIYDAVQ